MILSAVVAITFLKPSHGVADSYCGLDYEVLSSVVNTPILEGKKGPDGVWRWPDGEEFIPSSPQ